MSTENPTIDTIRGKGESHPVDPRRECWRTAPQSPVSFPIRPSRCKTIRQ